MVPTQENRGDILSVIAGHRLQAGDLNSKVLDSWIRVDDGPTEEICVSGVHHSISATSGMVQVCIEMVLPTGLTRYHYLDPSQWVELI